jgi:hypothetical protein
MEASVICLPESAVSMFWWSLTRQMAPLIETERRDFWGICEERYQTRSVILTSQMPVARWHEQIGQKWLGLWV